MNPYLHLPAHFTILYCSMKSLLLALLAGVLFLYPFASAFATHQTSKGENKPSSNSITDKQENIHQLNGSCWRDDRTGDWIIGIYPEGVVYDSKFWEYISRDEKAGEIRLHSDEGYENLSIKIGKEKDAKRSFKIGTKKPRVLSRITEENLPAYPTKEYRAKFEDTRYQWEDSVTIYGWIRELPSERIPSNGNITVYHSPFFYGNSVSTTMDSIGRFSITFPVLNSSRITMDIGGYGVIVPVEPGEKYFFLMDFQGDKVLFMGDDVRIQNELISHMRSIEPFEVSKSTYDIIDKVENWRTSMNASIDSLRMAEPTLSELALEYLKEDAMMKAALDLGELRFKFPFFHFPQPETEYIRKTFWGPLTQPATVYTLYPIFLNYYIESELYNSDYILNPKYGASYAVIIIPKKVAQEVKPDITFLKEYIKDGSFNYMFSLSDSIENSLKRIEVKTSEMLPIKGLSPQEKFSYKDLMSRIDILNDLNASPEIVDIYLMGYYIDQMDHNVAPLSNEVKNRLDSVISSPLIRKIILRKNAEYEKSVDKSKTFVLNLNKGEEMSEITEGRALFEKLVEPFRGKYVLIDIWGTWCVPCRKAMKDFQKEYNTLFPYGVAFLFLANNSEDEVIKTVVGDYNVTGKDVVHYNLPEIQQKALEGYLNVDGYPTYILVNPEGNIVKEHIDAMDLEGLEKTINELSSK